ncbi:MAG: hypothetical protein ACKVWR_18525 [Acidimicrobiales bacterium]
MADTVTAVADVHDYLTWAMAADMVDNSSEFDPAMEETAREALITSTAAALPPPLVSARDGSLVLEIAQTLDSTIGLQALAFLGVLLKKGPEIAGLPGRVRESWYSQNEKALRARQSYERLKRTSLIEVDPADGDDPPAKPPPRLRRKQP